MRTKRLKTDRRMPEWLQQTMTAGWRPSQSSGQLPEGALFAFVNPRGTVVHRWPRRRVVVLEGIPGAGKTTVTHMLSSDPAVETVPQILPRDPGSMRPVSYYQRSDILKTRRIRACRAPMCVLDRYVYSTLSYYWAHDQRYGTRHYPALVAWYRRALSNGSLIRPDVICVLDISPRVSQRRCRHRRRYDSPWTDSRFLGYVREYYQTELPVVEPRVARVVIRAAGTSESVFSAVNGILYGQ